MRNDLISDPLIISREDPAQPEIIQLLQNGEAEAARLYPAESNHHVALDGLRQTGVCFVVGRDAKGTALATGAFIPHDDWAEIKRMWVEERARGRGIARKILDALMVEARGAGIKLLRLETGVESHAALALYKKAGFKRREPFADYRPDPLSVFMERSL